MTDKKSDNGFNAGILVALHSVRMAGDKNIAIEIMQGLGNYCEVFDYALDNANEVDLDTINWLQEIATPDELNGV